MSGPGGPATPMDRFDYPLPDTAIAQQPAEPRSAARLLVALAAGAEPEDRTVADLPDLVGPGDLLVVNDTRVLPARLTLHKRTGGQVEVLLLHPADPDDPVDTATGWVGLVRPGRRVPPGTELLHGTAIAVVVGDELPGPEGRRLVQLADPAVPARVGDVPLPPYIRRRLDDPDRYQTVYARRPGSVAAPTAGLHLTEAVLRRCRQRGAAVATVDLAVGLGTFRPVTAARPEDHVMHQERYHVPRTTLAACRQARRVVAVGTTTVRALESAAATGVRSGSTGLFIHGDFPWRVVDVLLTNFHLPRSSLLLLVDAFYGPGWRSLYDTALRRGYRFLSFGDAMLLGRGAGVPGGGAGMPGGGADLSGGGAEMSDRSTGT